MNELSRLVLLHFEKALVGLFGAALLFSLVFFGPWISSVDLNAQLDSVSKDLANKPVLTTDVVPPMPQEVDAFANAGRIVPQEPMKSSPFWPELPLDRNVTLLPPSDVAVQPNRGYNGVTWEINPNQSDVQNKVDFVGVQVDRAVVAENGVGEFQTMTKVGDRDYFTSAELYARAQTVAQAVIEKITEQRQQKTKTIVADYTIADLFNAVHDGLLTMAQLQKMVSDRVRKKVYSSGDAMDARDAIFTIRELSKDVNSEALSAGRKLTRQEVLARTLEMLGYNGGGRFRGATPPAPEVVAAQPAAPSGPGKPAAKGSQKLQPLVAFGDVNLFVDTAVNPDLEYVYRVRFWARDLTAEGAGQAETLIASAFAPETGTQPASPRPDTEFYLTGGDPTQDKAFILVRKWMPSHNAWAVRTYWVAPGEEIGRAEVMAKTDAAGSLVVDAAGKPVMETVDFSTDCVLLDFRKRPRAFEMGGVTSKYDPATGTMLSVDNEDSMLYDWLQIVFSDRKGNLRMKWKTLAALG